MIGNIQKAGGVRNQVPWPAVDGGNLLPLVAALLLVAGFSGVAAASGANLPAPDVETLHVEEVAETDAKIYGEIHSWGNRSGGDIGFQIRPEGADEWHTIYIGWESTPTQFAYRFDSLESGTTYEYRAMVETDGGRYTGDIKTFTTESSSEDSGGNDGGDKGGGEEEESGDGGVLSALQNLGDSVKNLPSKIQYILFNPFRAYASMAIESLTLVISWYPQIHPNPDVQDIHRLTLTVTFAMSTLAVIVTGILFQLGPVLGVSYRQARMILPRLFLALVFATVSPFLLQYTVDFADALTQAFQPDSASFMEVWQLSAELLLVIVFKATLLLIVGVMFVVRDVYLLFAAAISPLIALAWVFPQTKRYADTFIGAWWAALLIGPLDMLVLRLALTLLDPATGIPNYLLSMGALTLLAAVPYMVYTASQSMVGQASILAQGSMATIQQQTTRDNQQNRFSTHPQSYPGGTSESANQHRRTRTKRRANENTENKFSDIINDGDQQ